LLSSCWRVSWICAELFLPRIARMTRMGRRVLPHCSNCGRPIRVIRAIRGSDFGCGLPRCEHSARQEDLGELDLLQSFGRRVKPLKLSGQILVGIIDRIRFVEHLKFLYSVCPSPDEAVEF